MAVNVRNMPDDELFFGHKACAGCGGSLAVRAALKVLGPHAVSALPAGCMSAVGFNFPQLSFSNNAMITPFAATASVLSGIEAGLRAQGIKPDDCTVVGFAGDGGTADIGIQALSGAIDRNDDVLYICYDNEAYMNTGIQRSSSTPRFAKATTSPVGTVIPGKTQNKKNLTDIIAAHNVPYVAQTTFIGNFRDLYTKAKKAIYTPGPSFLNVMSPCPRGWEYPTEKLPEICKLAVETCVWPLFEVIDGVWHLSYEPKQKRPVEEYLRMQGRFRHMFKPGNEWMIEAVQQNVDENWEKLLNRCNQ